MTKFLFTLLLSLLLAGCASKDVKPVTRGFFPSQAEMSLTQGDHRVGTYTSNWKGFRTSSYWIEGDDGLIIIDTQFLLSAAEEMLDWAESVTGKKAVLAIVLHPNPDKFNGTSVFQKRGIRVITSDQVLSLIPAVHELRKGWFFDRFKPDYPDVQPKPESFGNKSTEIKVAGLTLKIHVLGKACSDAHVVVEFDKNLFVGDLVTIGFHSWLELGYLKEWISTVEMLQDFEPQFVRTGRGGSGDADSLVRQKKYLQDVVRVVESFHPKKGQSLSKKTRNLIQVKIETLYPSYEYKGFISNGLDSAWQRLAK